MRVQFADILHLWWLFGSLSCVSILLPTRNYRQELRGVGYNVRGQGASEKVQIVHHRGEYAGQSRHQRLRSFLRLHGTNIWACSLLDIEVI